MNIKEPNPYNVFDKRREYFPPEHFEYAKIPLQYNIGEAIQKWVETHLKSRYYIGRTLVLDEKNNMERAIHIGFESSKELSYFMLACPHLKYN